MKDRTQSVYSDDTTWQEELVYGKKHDGFFKSLPLPTIQQKFDNAPALLKATIAKLKEHGKFKDSDEQCIASLKTSQGHKYGFNFCTRESSDKKTEKLVLVMSHIKDNNFRNAEIRKFSPITPKNGVMRLQFFIALDDDKKPYFSIKDVEYLKGERKIYNPDEMVTYLTNDFIDDLVKSNPPVWYKKQTEEDNQVMSPTIS